MANRAAYAACSLVLEFHREETPAALAATILAANTNMASPHPKNEGEKRERKNDPKPKHAPE
jgi:hypothetical protein